MRQAVSFFGCVYASYNKCSCGGHYNTRITSPYGMTVPVCDTCDDAPSRYKLKVNTRNKFYDIRYTKEGRPLHSLPAVIEASRQVRHDLDAGTFDPTNYQKGTGHCSEYMTMEGFINYIFLRKVRLPLEDKLLLTEFVAPFLSTLSIYRATQGHIEDFIRTFDYKFESAERVRRLYRQILNQVTAN